MEGKVPSKVLGLVIEWAEDHQHELLQNRPFSLRSKNVKCSLQEKFHEWGYV